MGARVTKSRRVKPSSRICVARSPKRTSHITSVRDEAKVRYEKEGGDIYIVEGSPRQKAYLIMALCWFRFANYQANEKKETSSPARFLALDKDRESRFAIRLIRLPKKGTTRQYQYGAVATQSVPVRCRFIACPGAEERLTWQGGGGAGRDPDGCTTAGSSCAPVKTRGRSDKAFGREAFFRFA